MTHALSPAEHKQRQDAARARWAAAGGAAGAVAGALAAGAALRATAAHRWQEARAAHRQVVQPVVDAHRLKVALIGQREAVWKARIKGAFPPKLMAVVQQQKSREAATELKALSPFEWRAPIDENAHPEIEWSAPIDEDAYSQFEESPPIDENAYSEIAKRYQAIRRALEALRGKVPSIKKKRSASAPHQIAAHTRQIARQIEPSDNDPRIANWRAAMREWEAAGYPGKPPAKPKIKSLGPAGKISVKVGAGMSAGARAHKYTVKGNLNPADATRMRQELQFRLRMHSAERQYTERQRFSSALEAAIGRFRQIARPIPAARLKLPVHAAGGALGALAGAALAYGGARLFQRKDGLRKADGDATETPDPSDRLAEIADAAERKLGTGMASTFRLWKDDVAQNLGAPRAKPLLETIHTDLERATRPLHEAALLAAEVPPAGLKAEEGQSPYGIGFSLKTRAPEAETYLQQIRRDKIVGMTAGQRDTIQGLLLDAVSRGASPDDMARQIRRNIGLTPTQARNVENYREDLINLKPDVLTRALRDRRYDGPIGRALQTGEVLAPDAIDRYVDAYHRRYLAYRSMVIARTEGVGFANNGHMAAVRALLADNPDWTVIKTWNAKRDKHTRPDHYKAHGRSVIGIDTPFVMSSGDTMLWPHDPKGKARQIIQCRCFCATRMVHQAHASRFIAEGIPPFGEPMTADDLTSRKLESVSRE